MKKILSLMVFLTVFLNISLITAYEVELVFQDDGTVNHIVETPSFYWNNECDLSIGLYATATHTGSYNLFNKWYSPNETIVMQGNPPFTSDITCRLQGTGTGTNDRLNYYETRSTTQTSATTTSTWLRSTFTCDPNNDDIIEYSNTSKYDAYGYYPYVYTENTGGYCQIGAGSYPTAPVQVRQLINMLELGYQPDCGTIDLEKGKIASSTEACTSSGTSKNFATTWWSMYPFNSGATGTVNISLVSQNGYLAGGCGAVACNTNKIYLWNTDDNSTTDLSVAPPTELILSLIEDTDYFLFIGSQCSGLMVATGTCTIGYNNTDMTMRIFAYAPEWDCSAWSECEDSVRQRICTDPLGKIADKVEYEACALGVTENATLGFEEFESIQATICSPNYWTTILQYGYFSGYICQYVPLNITVSRPINWTVSGDTIYNNVYFMDFTSEWATEGSRSLKMWTIPPKQAEPIYNAGAGALECTNRTSMEFPVISNLFNNETMRANFNVSFPETNMRLRFDVKKCNNQVQQHGELRIWNATGIGEIFDRTLCNELCYGLSCDNEPTGQFYYDLIDVNSNSLFGTTQYIDLDVIQPSGRKVTIEYDLSNSGIEAGINYTLSYAVFTQNPLDTNGNCVMIDNVRYDVLETPFLSIMGGECKSQCVGSDYYQASEISSGCMVKVFRFSDICIDSQFEDEIANLSDYCSDSNTLNHYNTLIADYEESDCEYGCEDGHCLTQEEAEETTSLEEEDNAYTLVYEAGMFFFFTRMGLAIVIITIMMFLGIWVSKGRWEAGAVISIIFIAGFTALGWFPIEWAFLIGVGEALGIVFLSQKMLKGGG